MFDKLSARYGWTNEQIWDLTETEINEKIIEIRNAEMQEILNKYYEYGKSGIEQLLKLPDDNPIKMEFIRREKEKEAKEFKTDVSILLKTRVILDRLKKEMVN